MMYHDYLTQAIELGAVLLENGAETYRVEESLLRMFQSRGVEKADVFVIPSMLIVTIHPDDTFKSFTQQKRIRVRGTDLTKLSEANALVRRACAEEMTSEELKVAIKAIRKGLTYNTMEQYVGYAAGGVGFCLFFGGSMLDAGLSIFSSLAVKFIFDQMGKLGHNAFFTNVLASAFLTLWAALMSVPFIGGNMDNIIIGPMMLLVPGMALTTSMRDIIAGDYLSSIVKLVEVLMIGLGVALGAYLAMTGLSLAFGI